MMAMGDAIRDPNQRQGQDMMAMGDAIRDPNQPQGQDMMALGDPIKPPTNGMTTIEMNALKDTKGLAKDIQI